MAGIHITDIESAINWWRERSPSPDGITACPQVRALAEVYALLVYYRESECDEATMPAKAHAAWLDWYRTTPDAPCIAICSTSQGDEICKGCGRTFGEVQHWTAMSPAEKRATWRRITLDGSAWRFNRYAERADDGTPAAAPQVSSAGAEAATAGGGPAPAANPAPAGRVPGTTGTGDPTLAEADIAAGDAAGPTAASAVRPDAPDAGRPG